MNIALAALLALAAGGLIYAATAFMKTINREYLNSDE